MMIQLKNKILNFIKKYPDGIVCVVGPTASGKTSLSLSLIDAGIDAEIISADSRQIFKYMDIGTDKISKDIQKKIPHHMIDICEPNENFTAGDWNKIVKKKIIEIHTKNKIPMIVGGTGLYIDTLYKNYTLPKCPPDEEFRQKLYEKELKTLGILHKQLQEIDPISASKIHPNSTRYIVRALEIYNQTGKPKSQICKQKPVDFPMFVIIKRADKQIANPKIDKRINEMLQEGLIQEVKNLLKMGYTLNNQSLQSIGYKEIVGFLQGKYDLQTAISELQKNTYRYAKRQRTFFRRYINDSENPKENVYFEIL